MKVNQADISASFVSHRHLKEALPIPCQLFKVILVSDDQFSFSLDLLNLTLSDSKLRRHLCSFILCHEFQSLCDVLCKSWTLTIIAFSRILKH